MAVIDYDVIDTAKAVELCNDPEAAERLIQAVAEQVIVDLQASGLPGNVEVETLAESEGDDTLRGIVVKDFDHSVAIRLVLTDGELRMNAVCLRHDGACICMGRMLGDGLCRVLNAHMATLVRRAE